MSGFLSVLLIAVSLSMDAFAVAVCKGLAMQRVTWKSAAAVGVWFGIFQAMMPAIGFFLARLFAEQITELDHWISFGLLCLLGGNMIREALFPGKEEAANASLAPALMLLLSLATSIDALAVGVVFAFSGIANIWASVFVIGLVTFLLSSAGVFVGGVFGVKYQARAELAGGIILILLGVKILASDLVPGLRLPFFMKW